MTHIARITSIRRFMGYPLPGSCIISYHGNGWWPWEPGIAMMSRHLPRSDAGGTYGQDRDRRWRRPRHGAVRTARALHRPRLSGLWTIVGRPHLLSDG